jgi:hypothetical protein
MAGCKKTKQKKKTVELMHPGQRLSLSVDLQTSEKD